MTTVDERDLLIENAKFRIAEGINRMNDLARGHTITGMSPLDMFHSALDFLDRAQNRTSDKPAERE